MADDSSAMGVARDAVLEGGVVFLDAMLPKADVDTLKQMGPQLADGFFNAEGVTALEGEEFRFTVSRCRFVELLDAANAAHLKPLFCEVDNAYFERDQSLITLRRDRTLAAGDAACEFRFRASVAGETRPADSR